MNTISSFFLRAKYWQFWLVLFAVFIVDYKLHKSAMVAGVLTAEDVSKLNFWRALFVTGSMLLISGWYWSAGSFLHSIVPSSQRMRMRYFRFTFVLPPFYMLAIMVKTSIPVIAMFADSHLMHYLAMFCMLYNMYFISKSLVLAETGQPAAFRGYFWDIFALLLFPIGIWCIQPRINRIYAQIRNGDRDKFPS